MADKPMKIPGPDHPIRSRLTRLASLSRSAGKRSPTPRCVDASRGLLSACSVFSPRGRRYGRAHA